MLQEKIKSKLVECNGCASTSTAVQPVLGGGVREAGSAGHNKR